MELLQGKSGVQILFRKMPTQIVDMRYIVRVGAVDEKPEEEGYCHALEHMLYAGSEKRKWYEVNQDWEKIGAWANAFTHLDKTGYHVSCLKKYWKEAYEILADGMYNPAFPEERWEEVEKSAVISEIQECHDNEDWVVAEESFRDALGPSYHSEVGNIDIIRKAKMSDLRKFYDQYYCGSNVLLMITGDLTKEEVLKVVNKYDRLSSKKPTPRPRLVYDFNFRPLHLNYSREQSILYLMKPVYMPRTLRSRAGLELGVDCLGQYLYEELREKRGLCYGVTVELEWTIPNNVFLYVKTASEKKDFKAIEQEAKSALGRFCTDGLVPERIENMKLYDSYCTMESKEIVADSPAWMWDAWEEQIYVDPFESHAEILEALNTGSVRRTVDRALQGRMKITRLHD